MTKKIYEDWAPTDIYPSDTEQLKALLTQLLEHLELDVETRVLEMNRAGRKYYTNEWRLVRK